MPPELDHEDLHDLIVLTGMATDSELDDLLFDLLVHTHPTKVSQSN
jgi:hypothetical protein